MAKPGESDFLPLYLPEGYLSGAKVVQARAIQGQFRHDGWNEFPHDRPELGECMGVHSGNSGVSQETEVVVKQHRAGVVVS